MYDPILARDWNKDLAAQINQNIFKSIPQFFLIHIVIELVDYSTIMHGLDVPIADH